MEAGIAAENKAAGVAALEFHENVGVLTLEAIQHISGSAIKARDVEVARCTVDAPAFTKVADTEVERLLTKMAEQD